jgi:hypothetical protein
MILKIIEQEKASELGKFFDDKYHYNLKPLKEYIENKERSNNANSRFGFREQCLVHKIQLDLGESFSQT